MPLTPRGLIYPAEADHTRLWEHLENLADSADTALDAIDVTNDEYTAYAPVWTASTTNPTLGNGSLTGGYIKRGRNVDFFIRTVFGSTTAGGSGTYSWTLPFAAASSFDGVGWGVAFDSSASLVLPRICFTNTGTTVVMHDMSGVRVSNAAPFAVANADRFHLCGSYQSAA
jgi:hypothetical protein